jgi:hypothetical protein
MLAWFETMPDAVPRDWAANSELQRNAISAQPAAWRTMKME